MPILALTSGTPSFSAMFDAASRLGVEVLVCGEGEPEPKQMPGACIVVDLDADDTGDAVQSSVGASAILRVRQLAAAGALPVVVGGRLALADVAPLFAAGAREVIATPLHKRELILRLGAVIRRRYRVACIGGGTGLFTVLSALKDVPGLLLSSIVAMSDDGGSSGILRTSFGVLPPGDVRRSLVALSNAPEVMSYVMQFRFDKGDDLSGHSLGNLLLTALAARTGGMPQAVKSLGDVLNVQGHVMCVTEQATVLCAEFEDGRIVRGESAIDRCLERPRSLRVSRVWHEPAAQTTVDVLAAIHAADMLVLGPGDMITSLLAGLRVGGVADAVRQSRAKRLYVCNLMTKPGETDGYDAAEHVATVNEALGGDALDVVLVSSSTLEPEAVSAYAVNHQHPVAFDELRMRAVTRAEVLALEIGDRATLVRHDPSRLREAVERVLRARRPSTAPSLPP